MDNKAEHIYNEILSDCKNSTIYNSDLEEETIEFYQKHPEVFTKTKSEIINDILTKKDKIIEEITQNEN